MKLRRKSALKTSLTVMCLGFLLSLASLFGDKILADSTTSVANANSLTWVIMGIVGVTAIAVGLIGVIFGIAAYKD